MSRPQGPVDHAVDGIEDPEPADAAERYGRDPGKQDQESQQPLAAEITQQRHRQHVREYQDENWEMSVNTTVFFTATQNVSLSTTRRKFSRPTKCISRLATVASDKL